ncbi:hypothetical protein L7F22_017210 [Adiantum nelumboides]|nr:hypothetical protein [Adiantum nelumboides]
MMQEDLESVEIFNNLDNHGDAFLINHRDMVNATLVDSLAKKFEKGKENTMVEAPKFELVNLKHESDMFEIMKCLDMEVNAFDDHVYINKVMRNVFPIVGNLIYMTISRPDLSYAIGFVSQFMQLPRKPHLDAVRRIMRYVRATLDYALFYDAVAHALLPPHQHAPGGEASAGVESTSSCFTTCSLVTRAYMDNNSKLIGSSSSGSSGADAAGRASVSSPVKLRSSIQDVGAANNSAPHPPIKCPRCDSLSTKFCYYNNYSPTQPRHFCKNCRRYWTEGGALRNVPVGGGCRKNKRIKHRPLINIGAATGLLDPSSLIDDTTSNMLARLGSSPPFHNFSGASSFGSNADANTHLLNIAFSRFQESMRLRQSCDQSSEINSPYLDSTFPALVHKQSSAPFTCLCGSCGSHAHSLHHGGCGGLMNSLENNLGFGTLPGKAELDMSMAGFGNGGYELNPLNHDSSSYNIHNMMGTSATATLASIEDQLSSFSNLQHVDSFNTDTSTAVVEQRPYVLREGTGTNIVAGPLQLVGHVENAGELKVQAAYKDESDMDERPLLSSITTDNDLSLMMSLDGSWQQPSLMMNEMLSESQQQQSNLWSVNATSRCQDNMHLMVTPPATAAGGGL